MERAKIKDAKPEWVKTKDYAEWIVDICQRMIDATDYKHPLWDNEACAWFIDENSDEFIAWFRSQLFAVDLGIRKHEALAKKATTNYELALRAYKAFAEMELPEQVPIAVFECCYKQHIKNNQN